MKEENRKLSQQGSLRVSLTMPSPQRRSPRLYVVKKSAIHGRGVFAATTIPKGTRIIEYTGERISHAEAAVRYQGEPDPNTIVLLFTVNRKVVLDAAVGGNAARFINHSCVPNCETVSDDGHIFIEALRRIESREELTYDYNLNLSTRRTKKDEAAYQCGCGSHKCRGTLLAPLQKRKQQK
jgi:SET domain-containing protein